MRGSIILAILCAMVAGCGVDKIAVVTPEMEPQMIQQLENGTAVLDCEIACSWPWITNQKELSALYRAGAWSQLSIKVMQIGIQTDLGYFYLGRAADGLGAYQAAIRYYRIAGAISTRGPTWSRCALNTAIIPLLTDWPDQVILSIDRPAL